MGQTIRVAVVLPYFGSGGAEKMVSQLVCAIDGTEFQTEVFCVYGQPQGSPLEYAIEEKGIPIHYIGKSKGFSLSAIVRLFRALNRFDPHVVHTHLYACVYTALWPLLRKKPFLHTFHTLPEVENKRLVRRLLTKYMIRRGKLHPVAISASNRELVARFYGISQVSLVQNPVELHRFVGGPRPDDGIFRFITVGRLTAVKNQQMMLHAFASFVGQKDNCRLFLLGRGEAEADLKALAASLGIENYVEFAGHVPNVEDYLANADAFLLSSHYEAQPLSVLEAMAAGLPILSTDVGGLRDIVTDNGILIPAEDAKAMSDAMERLYANRELREKMAARSAQYAQAFDVRNTARGYEALYRNHATAKQSKHERKNRV